MTKRIALCFAALLLSFSGNVAMAQDAAPTAPVTPDPARVAVAVEILEETHAASNMNLMVDQLTPQVVAEVKRNKPDIGDSTLKLIGDMFKDEMNSNLPDLLKMQAQVYASHFSLEELQGIQKFYQSDVGKKVVTEMPSILKETLPIGMAWGREMGQRAMARVVEKLRAQGIKI